MLYEVITHDAAFRVVSHRNIVDARACPRHGQHAGIDGFIVQFLAAQQQRIGVLLIRADPVGVGGKASYNFV